MPISPKRCRCSRPSQYDSIYSFEYSERPDTPALKLALRDDVPAEVKAERLQAVQTLQKGITARRLSRWVGRDAEVLVEGDSARHPGQLCGRTTGNEMVNFAGPPSLTGQAGAGTHRRRRAGTRSSVSTPRRRSGSR